MAHFRLPSVTLAAREPASCLLLAAAAMAALACPPAEAQSTPSAPAPLHAPNETWSWDIPAGPLDATLLRIAQRSGQPISVPPELVRGRQAPAISGRLTAEGAARSAIAGQPLALIRTANGTLTLRSRPEGIGGAVTLDTVNVTANSAQETATGPVPGYVARRSATGTKTDTPLIETPQSVSVVTRDQMDAQGAQTVTDALHYTAGVLAGSNGGQTRFDSVFVRGFGGLSDNATYTQYIDGLGWPHITRTAVQMDPYALERVEVLRGPSSVLYGQAEPGGFVNMISKSPTTEPVHELMLQYGNHDNKAVGVDLGGALNDSGTLSYRLAGLVRDSSTGVDYQKDERQFVAPSIRWAPDANTSLTLRAFFQHDPRQPDTSFVPYEYAGVGSTTSPYGKLPKHYFQGDPDYDSFSRTIKTIGWEFEHRFNDTWKVRQNFRAGWFNSDTRQLSNNEVSADYLSVSRYAIRHLADVNTVEMDNQVEARFDTGAVEHTVLIGLDWRHTDSHLDYGYSYDVPDQTVYHPTYGYRIGLPAFLQHTGSEAQQTGLYVQDQMRVGRWSLLAGLRRDRATDDIDVTRLSTGAVSSTRTSDDATTGRVGAVYQADNGIAPYVSYSTSFDPVVGSTDRQGEPFRPTKGKQLEAGVRWQPPGTRSMYTVSVYEIKQRNVLSADPVDSDYSVQTGEIRSRGIEFEGKMQLTRDLNLLANYSYSAVKVTESTTAGARGKRPVATPSTLASAWLDYRLAGLGLPNLTVGAGVRYVGHTYADEANTVRVPSYTLVDAMARYDIDKSLSLAVNALNLANRQYAAACSYGTCWQGSGRSVVATMKYRW